jgi:hypothetical protein
MLHICLFCRFMQAALDLTGGEKRHAAFLSVVECGEAFNVLGINNVA